MLKSHVDSDPFGTKKKKDNEFNKVENEGSGELGNGG